MSGNCLDAPAFHRNHAPIADVLRRLLGDKNGNIIEIGSGTGQHLVTFAAALPRLIWWPSDPIPMHRDSIDAWQAKRALANVRSSVDIDAAASDWALGRDGRPPADDIDAILCINVLHITSWLVSLGLLRAAKRYIKRDGVLVVYGPFARDGVHIAASNMTFDAHLRQQNDLWGVRDTADLDVAAREHGLRLAENIDMPANNSILLFQHAELFP